MSYQKIGFLTKGSGGNPTGIGDYVARLDAAGKPAVIGCNDGTVGLSDVFNVWKSGSLVDHILAYRSVAGVPHNPNYSLDPVTAANNFFATIEPTIPIEVKQRRDRVWIILGNEPDKTRTKWLADWGVRSFNVWTAAGYKIVLFNFSSGEPEPDHWRDPKMSTLLSLAAANRDKLAIGLHEYSFRSEPFVDENLDSRGPIWYQFPYRVGRFRDLFAACDERGIGRPSVLITEWGWRDTTIPDHDLAMFDIREIADVYGEHEEILGCLTWYLGDWQGSGIENKVQRLIAPVTDFSIAYVPPISSEPPKPPNETFNQFVWRRSIEEQTVSFNPDALLQKKLNAAGLSIVGSEFWDDYNGVTYAIQAGESIPGTAPRMVAVARVPNPGEPWPDPTLISEPMSGSLDGFMIGAPFRVPFAKTSSFNDFRDYGNNKHEGIDFDVLGVDVDSKEPVLAGVSGVVVEPEPLLAGYGIHVVIETIYRGEIVRVWYCHLDKSFVNIGDFVTTGDPVGEIGDTSGTRPLGEHVHINLQVPGRGLSGYVVSDVINPEPFVVFEPVTTPPAGQIHLAKYFSVPPVSNYWNESIGRYVGDIVILKNNWGEGDERQQIQGAPDEWLITKNQLAECRFVGDQAIWFKWDSSPGNGRVYEVSGDPWLPISMVVGETHSRRERTTWYDMETCNRLPEHDSEWTTGIRFREHFGAFQTGVFDGSEPAPEFIIVPDVVCFEWIVGGSVVETYHYAAGLGLVQWETNDGRRSWAYQLISRFDQAANSGIKIFNC